MCNVDAASEMEIEVRLPKELLEEIDAFAARRGYASPDAVVREALERTDQ